MNLNWSRILHTISAAAGFVVVAGPQALPMLPPAAQRIVGGLILLASSLGTILGRQAGQSTDQSKP